jgi:polyhydroxyalkanoate synthesis regulator phasin
MMKHFKKMALTQAMKLMSNPKFTKFISDPRVMNAIAKGFEVQGQVRSQVEGTLKSLADNLNLATKDEVSTLRRKLGKVEDHLDELQNHVEEPKG